MTTTSALDHANLLAGQAVAACEAYLDGRRDAAQLAADAQSLQLLLFARNDASAHMLLDPVRILNIAMLRTAAHAQAVHGAAAFPASPLAENISVIAARLVRWRSVMASLVTLVREESRLIADRATSREAEQQRARA